ncbi:MAG: DUF2269 domain-containing protein [Bernardetiaceae bacterium]|jgi:uncharacterized membrane protein|nr:DUF2269 domain-containing protein [Bernardetiaceae bacterium]
MYLTLKLIHIVAAIVAVGFNLSYIVWLVKGKAQPEHQLFALRGIKLMDDWLANPSYLLSLITGLLMAYVGNFNVLEIKWLLVSLSLFGLMGVVAFGFYTPALARQIRVWQQNGPQSAEYRRADQRQTVVGLLLFALALAIVAIMVLKPSF